MRTLILGYVLTVTLLLIVVVQLLRPEATTPERTIEVSQALQSDTAGYTRADRVRNFRFPEDHGVHPGFKTEWWYFTGNLEDAEGRRWGYQLTLFRNALAPPRELKNRSSSWAADAIFMGHLAISDISGRRFKAAERFARGDGRMSGTRSEPITVFLGTWSVTHLGGDRFRLLAGDGEMRLDLQVSAGSPPVLQGNNGLDAKGTGLGNASYYYSVPRMETRGTLWFAGGRQQVHGLSWMDREWSTSVLSEGQIGWDWFAVHLSDGSDLMYYRIRETGDRTGAYTKAMLRKPDGTIHKYGAEAIQMKPGRSWRSPHSKVTYPASWVITIPAADLSLEVETAHPDQELNLSVRYYEGAVDVTGRHGGRTVTGTGYVELTGYGEGAAGRH